MDRTTRTRLVAAGTLSVAGLLLLGACGGGGGGGAATPTSVVDSTAFRTIPVTAAPTTAPPPPPAADAGGQTGTGSAGDAGGGAPQGGVQGNVYTVVDNDFWYGIADKLGVKAEILARYNDMTIETPLFTGMQLRIPPASVTGDGSSSGGSASGGSGGGGAGSTQAPADSGYYLAVANDFWPSIASKLGVTLEALLAANNATMQTPVYVGQKIKIPS